MSANSNIEWCDHTFNPWEGCQKVSPGCDHCYAETRNARFGGGTAPNWGPGAPRRRTSPANWRQPIAWNAAGAIEQHGRRQRVFCASLADVFDNAIDPQWRADLFDLIDRTPNLDWLLLTKRIGNVAGMLADLGRAALPAHVWLGATVVNRDEMLRDGPKLQAVTATIRFWSYEPALGPLGYIPTGLFPDWVIAGGESGHGARPMHPDWARSLRDQCADAGVPFLFKQWGEWVDMAGGGIGEDRPITDRHGNVRDWLNRYIVAADESRGDRVRAHSFTGHATDLVYRVGKARAGRLLDGIEHNGFPQ